MQLGAIRLQNVFAHPATWADSHAFAIPNNVDKAMTPEKKKAVLDVIALKIVRSRAADECRHKATGFQLVDSASTVDLIRPCIGAHNEIVATATLDKSVLSIDRCGARL